MKRLIAAAIVSLIVLAGSVGMATAQSAGHGMHGAAEQGSTEAYREAMDRMHETMAALDYSDNADVDFARGMIPHHQAAIDMARIVLEHGQDPEIRKLAEEVIDAQEREIRQLEEWLSRNGG